MKLSIVTINYNNTAGLKKTLESVAHQHLDGDIELEHIIIDGASTDGSVDIIKPYTSCIVHRQPSIERVHRQPSIERVHRQLSMSFSSILGLLYSYLAVIFVHETTFLMNFLLIRYFFVILPQKRKNHGFQLSDVNSVSIKM